MMLRTARIIDHSALNEMKMVERTRQRAYIPVSVATPDRIADMGDGAAEYASGSHV